MKAHVFFRTAKAYPLFHTILMSLVNRIPAMAKTIKRLRKDTKDKTLRRISAKTDRKDFMRYILFFFVDG